jgi:hypothetical protein
MNKYSMKTFLSTLAIVLLFGFCAVFSSCNSCSSSLPVSSSSFDSEELYHRSDCNINRYTLGTQEYFAWGNVYENVCRYMVDSMQYVFEHVSVDGFMDDPASYMQRYIFNEYFLVVVYLPSIIADAYFFIDETDKIVNMTYIYNTYRADDDAEKRFVRDWDNDGRDELIEYRTEYGLGEDVSTKLCIYSFTGNEMKEVNPVSGENIGPETGKIYKRPFQDKTLIVTEQNPNEACSINYCVFDDSVMIEFHREFIGCHQLEDVIVEDWDGDGTEDIRVIYSEYIDYHDCINEAVFSLEDNRLTLLFFITTDDKFYYEEEYPENAPYYYRKYKKTKSGVLIHEYECTINLDEKSADYEKVTHINDRTYEEPFVNEDLEITDIYRFEDY